MRRDGSRLTLGALAGLCLCFAAAPAFACPDGQRMAARIDRVLGDPANILWRSGGGVLTAVPDGSLCPNDQVDIDGNAALEVVYFDGRRERMGPGRHVIAPVAGESIFSAAYEMTVGKVFAALETTTGVTAGRGDDPSPAAFTVDALGEGRARLSPAWRSLALNWRGGGRSFAVTLTRPDGSTAAQVLDVADHGVVLPTGPMAPGVWRVRLRDGDRLVEGSFTVTSALPPPDLAAGPDAEGDNAARAVLMAADPTLALEAEQMLAATPATGLDRAFMLNAITCMGAASSHPALCGARG